MFIDADASDSLTPQHLAIKKPLLAYKSRARTHQPLRYLESVDSLIRPILAGLCPKFVAAVSSSAAGRGPSKGKLVTAYDSLWDADSSGGFSQHKKTPFHFHLFRVSSGWFVAREQKWIKGYLPSSTQMGAK